jgi:hypothetical protein
MAQGEGVKQLKDLSQGKLRIAKSINVYIFIYTFALLFTSPPDLVGTTRQAIDFGTQVWYFRLPRVLYFSKGDPVFTGTIKLQ